MQALNRRVFPIAKELAYRFHVNRGFFDRYPYMFSPAQLAYLCERIDAASELGGAFVEIGCASGATTVYLNRHMTCAGIERPYVCVDTFSGFTARDVEYEVERRGKRVASLRSFRTNKRKWFERTMQVNALERVTVHEADAATFDFGSVAPIAFCLVDVDLYVPVKAAMAGVYEAMLAGGTLVVDDCQAREGIFDGAAQAYREFVDARGLDHVVVHDQLGVVHKPG